MQISEIFAKHTHSIHLESVLCWATVAQWVKTTFEMGWIIEPPKGMLRSLGQASLHIPVDLKAGQIFALPALMRCLKWLNAQWHLLYLDLTFLSAINPFTLKTFLPLPPHSSPLCCKRGCCIPLANPKNFSQRKEMEKLFWVSPKNHLYYGLSISNPLV